MPSSRAGSIFGVVPMAAYQRLERISIDGPTGDILRDQRNAAPAGALERERRILRDERLYAEPDHLRQVLIGRVLRVHHQLARDAPARRVIQALQGGGQIEPHDGRAILARHAGEGLDRG